MDEPIVLSNEELRRRLAVYRGKVFKRKPTIDDKSTEFHLNDIFILSKINNNKRFYDFMMGRTTFGPRIRARLTKIVMTLDGGYATKTQFGVYHFYNKPVVPPRVVMTVNLGAGGLRLGVTQNNPAPKMPAFMDIFKGN